MIRQDSLARPTPSLSGLRVRPLLAGIAIAVSILTVLWLPSLAGARWYSDEGVFAAVAQAWRGGATLYDGAWDNKPPLIFITYASAQTVFGDSLIGPRALALLAAAGTVAITVAIGARLYGHARGAVAGATAAVVLGSSIIEGNLALTETFMVFPTAAGVLITLSAFRPDYAGDEPRSRRLLLAAGLCFGLAMGYKQVAVFDLAAAALLLLMVHPRPLRALSLLLAGAMVPQVVLLLFFAAIGAGHGYVYATLSSLPDYTAAVEHPRPLWSTLLGYAPLALALAYAATTRRSFEVRTFPVVWLAFAFAGAASSPYAFPHYLVQAAVPFALVAAGLSLGALRSRALLATTCIAALTVGSAVAIFGPEIRERQQSNPRWYYDTALDYAGGKLTLSEYEGRMDGSAYSVDVIASSIERDARGEGLFVWGDYPWLYSATQLHNPTPFATPWLVQWVPGAREDVIADLQAHPPAYIVISSSVDAYPALEWLAARDYALIDQRDDWRLYGISSADHARSHY